MKLEEFEITTGENAHQKAAAENNDRMIDYSASRRLTFTEILGVKKGLDVISEFFDVNSAASVFGTGICSVALGKSPQEAVMQIMDSSPIDFINAVITVSAEVDSDIARMLKKTNIIVSPKFTPNAVKYLDEHEICYIEIKTPLKDYKKFLSNDVFVTPLGTLEQAPNLSELDKETFKVVTKTKPSVEQIEDAVFAWKVAKHAKSQSIVIAKDLKTSAISQGLQASIVEHALNYSCERAKEAVLASDLPLTIHDINAAIQSRIGLIIIPHSSNDITEAADKYNIAVITTGLTNTLY